MQERMPIGFFMALTQDKSAMQHFAQLSNPEREGLMRRVKGSSDAEMAVLAHSLSREVSAVEFH